MAVVRAKFAAPVAPRSRRNAVEWRGAVFFVQTTTAPEDGRATAAVAQALADGLGVAKSRLVLVRGGCAARQGVSTDLTAPNALALFPPPYFRSIR